MLKFVQLPGKALVMKPQDTQHDQIEAWDYAVDRSYI